MLMLQVTTTPVANASVDNAYVTQTNIPVIAVQTPEPTPVVAPVFYESPKWTYCSCVNFAKWMTGNNDTVYGLASSIKPNTTEPIVGDWTLTKESLAGHVAVIVEIDAANGRFRTEEANWSRCKRSSRWLEFSDKKIRGFFRPGTLK